MNFVFNAEKREYPLRFSIIKKHTNKEIMTLRSTVNKVLRILVPMEEK